MTLIEGQSSQNWICCLLQWNNMTHQTGVLPLLHWHSVVVSMDCCFPVLWVQINLNGVACFPGIGTWWHPVWQLFNFHNYSHGKYFVNFSSPVVLLHWGISIVHGVWDGHDYSDGSCICQESILCLQNSLDTQQSTGGYLQSCLCLMYEVFMGLA